jgi:hypothetical protein
VLLLLLLLLQEIPVTTVAGVCIDFLQLVLPQHSFKHNAGVTAATSCAVAAA